MVQAIVRKHVGGSGVIGELRGRERDGRGRTRLVPVLVVIQWIHQVRNRCKLWRGNDVDDGGIEEGGSGIVNLMFKLANCFASCQLVSSIGPHEKTFFLRRK